MDRKKKIEKCVRLAADRTEIVSEAKTLIVLAPPASTARARLWLGVVVTLVLGVGWLVGIGLEWPLSLTIALGCLTALMAGLVLPGLYRTERQAYICEAMSKLMDTMESEAERYGLPK